MRVNHIHNQPLPILAVFTVSTNEVEVPGPVKIESALTIVKSCDGVTCVTIHVIRFLHAKN